MVTRDVALDQPDGVTAVAADGDLVLGEGDDRTPAVVILDDQPHVFADPRDRWLPAYSTRAEVGRPMRVG